MAKGTEGEDFVVLSKVRTGLKREFAFALKSQNEIAGSLGRTRTRKPANGVNGVQEAPSSKKFKKSAPVSRRNGEEDDAEGVNVLENGDVGKLGGSDGGGGPGKGECEKVVVESEGDLKSDVVDAVSDDDNRSRSAESLRAENNTDLTVNASDEGQKSDSDDSKGNAVMPASDVEMEEASEMEMSVGLSQCTAGINDKNEEIQDVPGALDDFATPDKPRKRFTRSALMSVSGETKDLPVNGGGEGGPDGKASGSASVAKHVGRLSSKFLIKTVPRKLKDLLETGLLEGLSVRYSRGFKCKLPKESGLQGVVRGSGILCSCVDCKGITVVSPTVFELHAGSSNKRPPDYTYLDNGNTLRDVLNACKASKLDDLETTIRNALGHFAEEKTTYCISCKAAISVAGKGKTRLLCDACMELKASEKTPKGLTKASDVPPEDLVYKSSDNAKKSASSGNKSHGRLTRKDLRLHKLVFEGDVLPDGTEVGYYVRGKKMLSGYKQGSGIFCMCCQKEVSPSQFEAHAGWASRRKPYLHIYTSNGVSLHELSVSLSKSRKFSTEDNDDLCSICCLPGHLLCCDGCPRAFHKDCIPMLEVPDGNWYCRYCETMFEREKFAEFNANAIAAGRVAGIDPIEQLTRRCVRVVKPQEPESGGCALCRAHDFAKGGFSHRTVMLCDQCEREFHVGCLRDHGMQDLKELPEGKWFCSSGCNRINSVLQQLLDDGEQKIPDCLLNIIKRKHAATNGSEDVKLDIKWRLLSGKMSAVASTRALLSKAVSVFHEQFDPIVLPDSNQDIIPHMIYGRNVKDKEFGGMYCAVLTVNSVIVSAGVFRVFGKDIAELPLVATASGCEKLGYFQVLYTCIEKLLGELDVNYLWLPAADEAKPLWTNKFGFSDFPTNEFVELKNRFSLMIFDGTCMLRKPVPKNHDASVLHEGAVQATDISEGHMEATEMVSMDVPVQVLVNRANGLALEEDNATQATWAFQDDGKQANGVNAMEVEAGELEEDGGKQATRVLQDDGKPATGVALDEDSSTQATRVLQDDGKQTNGVNAMEVEAGELKDCGGKPPTWVLQDDEKQTNGVNAMEIEAGELKVDGGKQATWVLQDDGKPAIGLALNEDSSTQAIWVLQDNGKQTNGVNAMEVEAGELKDYGEKPATRVLQDDGKQANGVNAMEVEAGELKDYGGKPATRVLQDDGKQANGVNAVEVEAGELKGNGGKLATRVLQDDGKPTNGVLLEGSMEVSKDGEDDGMQVTDVTQEGGIQSGDH